MKTLPSLKRYLAGGLTAVVFIAVMIISSLSGQRGVEPAANAQLAQSDASWPMFGGGPTRNMVNLTAKKLPEDWDIDPMKPMNVLWSADLGSRAYGGPTVADGKIFVGTNNQAPRNAKNRFIKVPEAGDVVTMVGKQAVKDAKELSGIIANLPLGTKNIECTYRSLKQGKEMTAKLPVEAKDLGVLMVFNQANGKFLYEITYDKLPNGQVCDWPLEGLCSTPTVEGKRVYYTSNRCEVICADTDGKVIWKLDMLNDLGVFPHNLTASCPLIIGDDLYLVTANGVDEGHINVPAPKAPSFLKLNKNTGQVLWQDNSPTIKLAEAKNSTDKDFMKTLVNRGELIQHGQWSNPAYAVVDGQPQVVWPGGDGWIYSFDPMGKLLWKFDCNPKDAKYELGNKGTRSDFIATPVIYKDRVYIGVGQDPEHNLSVGHLWCIDMKKRGDVSPDLVINDKVWPPLTKPNPNSAKIWHFGGMVEGKVKGGRSYHFGRTMSTCAIHDDLVYIAELAGWIHCLDANTGKLYWQHDAKSWTWSSPYWADNKIYLGVDSGTVLVFEHGKQMKLLAENDLNHPVRATPVAVGNVIYIISGNKLYALKK